MTGLFELHTVSVLLPVTERTEEDVEDGEEGAESRQRCPTGWSKYGSSCITANNWLSLQQTIRLQREAHYLTTPAPSLSLQTTQVVGLITDNDETAYREEVKDLAVWCKDNNLSLNVIKTKLFFVDFWKRTPPFSSTGLWWSRLRASSSLVSTSPTH